MECCNIQLRHVSEGGLHTFDVHEAMGFEIAGEDQIRLG